MNQTCNREHHPARSGLDIDLLRFLKERNVTYGTAQKALEGALSQLNFLLSMEKWHLPMPDGINEHFHVDDVQLSSKTNAHLPLPSCEELQESFKRTAETIVGKLPS